MKEATIKKKSRQGLIALGAIVLLFAAVTVRSGEDLGYLVLWLVLVALYILPTIIGIARKHPQILPIIIINALLGWTVIGWIGALIWAVASFEKKVEVPA